MRRATASTTLALVLGLAGPLLAEEPAALGARPQAADEHPAPARLGTPEASLAAAPAWWERPRGPRIGRARVYAPEAADAESLYARAPAIRSEVGELADAALACALDLGDRHFDEQVPFASPESVLGDIAAVAGIAPDARQAPGLVVVAFGPEDGNRVVFLLPLVQLRRGAWVSVGLTDMDVQSHDWLETVRARYEGALPLRLAGRVAAGECRLVARADLEARLTGLLSAADSVLDRTESGTFGLPSLTGRPVRGVDDALASARTAATAPASLVGWDDPRVALRLGRLEALAARLEGELAEAFGLARGQALGRTWTPVAGGSLELRISGLRCGRAALRPYARLVAFWKLVPRDACGLALGVRNRSEQPMDVDIDTIGPLDDLAIVDARGVHRPLYLEGQMVSGRARSLPTPRWSLAPGAEAELVAPPRPEEELLRQSAFPILVRGLVQDTPVYLDPGEPSTQPLPAAPKTRTKHKAKTEKKT